MTFPHTILAKLTLSIAGLLCLAQVGCACRPATDSASAPVAAPSETDEEKSGTASGEKVARELIALGQIQLRFEWGSLTGVTALLETTPGLAEHLRTTLKIDCRELGFAPRNAYERAYSASFNRTMVAHLETLHGKGFIFKAEEEAAYQQGKAAATRELAEGKLALETYGLPPVSRRAYMDLLKQRHGIQLRAVAGCIVNSTITGHARGFNEVMMAEIEKRHGPDALTKALADAEQICRAGFEDPKATETTATEAAPAASLLAQIALPQSHTSITATLEVEQRKLFAAWLEERTPRYFRIGAQRLFTVKRDTFAWGALAELIGVAVKNAHSSAVEDEAWRQPDYFTVRGWKLPERPGTALVVSTLTELPGQDAFLVGLFEILLPAAQE